MRMKNLTGALLLISMAAFVRADQAQAVLDAMRRAEKDIQTLSFSFKQNTLVRVTNDKQEMRGKAYFQRPNLFRVEHTSPRSQTVVSDGKALWFYSPAQNQVFTDSWENWGKSGGFPQGLMPFQTDVDDLRERYEIVYEGQSKELDILKLSPREAGPWPYTFRFWVNRAGLPVRTEMESQSVTATTEISQLKTNPKLSENMFRFTPPKGAEVLGAPQPFTTK